MTSPERFVAEREAAWEELDAALRRAGDRPERLGADGVRRLGELYRATAADLAFARRSFGDEPLVARLEGLVLRGRAAVYARSGRRASLWSFVSRGYWVRLAERPVLLAAAWLLLLVPAGLGAVWGLVDASAAAGIVPADFQSAADPPVEGRDYDAGEASAFSFSVMFNNIQVTLLAFAGGITFGLVTVWALFFNGLLLAIPALTALAALSVLSGLPPWRRGVAAVLTGLPFLGASFLAQSGFKETGMALFVVVVLCWVYFRRTRAMAGIPFYRPAAAYALALAVGLVGFHVAEAALHARVSGTPALEIPAGLVALAAYLATLDRLHAATRPHLARTAALFSPRQMREFLRERP